MIVVLAVVVLAVIVQALVVPAVVVQALYYSCTCDINSAGSFTGGNCIGVSCTCGNCTGVPDGCMVAGCFIVPVVTVREEVFIEGPLEPNYRTISG